MILGGTRQPPKQMHSWSPDDTAWGRSWLEIWWTGLDCNNYKLLLSNNTWSPPVKPILVLIERDRSLSHYLPVCRRAVMTGSGCVSVKYSEIFIVYSRSLTSCLGTLIPPFLVYIASLAPSQPPAVIQHWTIYLVQSWRKERHMASTFSPVMKRKSMTPRCLKSFHGWRFNVTT